jgi:hypothetical protein
MNDTFSKIEHNNMEICNSFGCINKATVKIVLPVGFKSVPIFVCENCVSKVEDNYNT